MKKNSVTQYPDAHRFTWQSRVTGDPAIASSEPVPYLEANGSGYSLAHKAVVLETSWPLVVNGKHWLTLLCTPNRLESLVLGFLFNEGIIEELSDVRDLTIRESPEAVINVDLCDITMNLPQHRTLTSGCGGGITFIDMAAQREPITADCRVSFSHLTTLMQMLVSRVADEHRDVGGFHTSALSFGEALDVVATDIGRHNTLDKLAGECLLRGLPTQDAILVTTGRVSGEMLGKAARMGIPVVVTQNSPTSLTIELASAWNMTLVGYARGRHLHVYTGWNRVKERET